MVDVRGSMGVTHPLNLTPPALPPRSRLYCLEPIGLDTAHVESLTGYIARLAAEHCVSAACLFGYELAPLIDSPYWKQKLSVMDNSALLGYGFSGQTPTLNGTGKAAAEWIKALETATRRPEIGRLTLFMWGEVLSTLGLLRRKRAWCPNCYEDRRARGQIAYEPLIWAIKPVTACIFHRRRLQTKCQHCHRQSFPLASKSCPGFCSLCRKWLGLPPTLPVTGDDVLSDAEWEWQVSVASNVGGLLSASPDLTDRPSKENVLHSLEICIERAFGGRASILSSQVRVPAQTISNWRAGVIPRLDALLRICFHSGVPLLSFLTRTIPSSAFPECPPDVANVATQPEVNKVRRTQRKLDLKSAKRQLRRALTKESPPSLMETAKRMGRRHTILRYHFPDLCDAIVERHSAYQKRCRSERYGSARLALEAALSDEARPSPADIARVIGWNLWNLLQVHPDLCRNLSDRHAEGRVERWLEVGRTLETMLNEWPPPPMREITERTRYSENSLYKHYPALCTSLAARYREYRKMKRRTHADETLGANDGRASKDA